jgi:hypothetical protein
MNGDVEFSVGMCEYTDNTMLISFGFQDNAAFVLRAPIPAVTNFISGNYELSNV